ncbi:hypothetical protein THAOC_32664, partial [Thalassiosira oceanica]
MPPRKPLLGLLLSCRETVGASASWNAVFDVSVDFPPLERRNEKTLPVLCVRNMTFMLAPNAEKMATAGSQASVQENRVLVATFWPSAHPSLERKDLAPRAVPPDKVPLRPRRGAARVLQGRPHERPLVLDRLVAEREERAPEHEADHRRPPSRRRA